MDELLMRAVAAEKLVDGDPESCHQQEAHTLWTALALRDAAKKLQETCRVLMERDCEGCPLLQDGRCVCGVSPVTWQTIKKSALDATTASAPDADRGAKEYTLKV